MKDLGVVMSAHSIMINNNTGIVAIMINQL